MLRNRASAAQTFPLCGARPETNNLQLRACPMQWFPAIFFSALLAAVLCVAARHLMLDE
jgi:hypothetical protein